MKNAHKLCGCGNACRDGQNNCLECHAAYMREHRLKHSELTPEAKKKANARSYANVYLRRGKIKKQTCKCGDSNSQMHHEDYDKPLEVIWLCRECHLDLHRINDYA